jgi:hypothetical protein
MSRPRLPGAGPNPCTAPLYVSDCSLSRCSESNDSCLFENISCFLITRELLKRFTARSYHALNLLLFGYSALFVVFVMYGHFQSLERFLLRPGRWPTMFEVLIAGLFYPLIVIALTGWMRMIFIWSALNRGVLDPLERLPLRFAFNRIKEVGWVTMLSQSSLHVRWRDMARAGESIRQIINNQDIRAAAASPAGWDALTQASDQLSEQIRALRYHIGLGISDQPPPVLKEECPTEDDDLPHALDRRDMLSKSVTPTSAKRSWSTS